MTVTADTASQTILEQRTALTFLSSERDQSCNTANQAREEAAMLRGQVTILQEQNARSLAAFKSNGGPAANFPR